MKAEVEQEDVVKHWGIWVKNDKFDNWLSSSDGVLLNFTCPRVANVQHDLLIEGEEFTDNELEVKEIK